MKVKCFNVSLPVQVASSLDSAATLDGISRSEYIRESIELHLQFDESVAYEMDSNESSFNAVRYWQLVKMAQWRSRNY